MTLRAIALIVVFLGAAGTSRAETVPLSSLAHIHAIAAVADDPDRLLLATHHGLYRAAPDGKAERISDHRDDLMGFTAHPTDPRTFFASGHPAKGGNLGFIISNDGGVSWRQVSPGLNGPVDFHQMDVGRSDPNVVYGVHGTLQRSMDGGKTWVQVGPPPAGLIDLAVSPSSPTTLYAATRTGLLSSRDGGKTWAPAMMIQRPTSMVESAADGKVYAYVVGTGVMRLDGPNWTTLGDIGNDRFVLYFAVAADRLYAVTQQSEILVSRDGGRSWRRYGP